MPDYQKPIPTLFQELQTTEKGITDFEALIRLRKFGLNRLKNIKKTKLIFKFLSQFKDIMVVILGVAALLALIMGEPRDVVIIIIIILINALIGFIQEFKAERILAAFSKHLSSFSKVVRNGKIKKLLSSEIVPGDVIFLEAGDAVPADARIIEAFDLRVNEFSLTGESLPRPKSVCDISEEKPLADIENTLFMGTSVTEGEVKAIVTKTGMNTELGKIAEKVQTVKEELTPLQKELEYIGKTTVKIALVIVVSTLLLFYFLGKTPKESLLFAIAAAVAVVPEGLPAATSVALSLGAQRMLKEKALVKKLLHVESLGSVTTICTDKTGTLTTGQMTVVKIVPWGEKNSTDLFLRNLVLCNNADAAQKIGDPLEIALLQYVQTQHVDIESVQENHPEVFEIPFSSERKMMTTVCLVDNNHHAYIKGASVAILKRSRLSQEEKDQIANTHDEMAASGLKVLALAYRDLGQRKDFKNFSIEEDLEFIGLVGLEDPPREGVAEALQSCREAGIKVYMVTGDNGLTALSIAKQIGLVKKNLEVKIITGDVLHQMDDETLRKTLKTEQVVFARIDPNQKLRIVKNLQELKEVVAVTGDGVNDAPALVKADIGVAMGEVGTEVSKEAADMILLDDHFATIVSAIQEGRRIFDNVKKFVFYVFSSNSGELFVALFGILAGLPLPLLAIQILAIDLGTDVFPSLALGVEEAEQRIMTQKPRAKGNRVMDATMLIRLLSVGLAMAILALLVYVFVLYQGGWRYGQFFIEDNSLYNKATASVYVTLVFCQMANVFSTRTGKFSFKNIFSNHWLVIGEIISFIILFSILYWPPLQGVFKVLPPSPIAWVFAIISFFIFFSLSEWIEKRLEGLKRLG